MYCYKALHLRCLQEYWIFPWVKTNLLNYGPYASSRLTCFRASRAFVPYVSSHLRVFAPSRLTCLRLFASCGRYVPCAVYLPTLLTRLLYLIYETHLCPLHLLFTRLKTCLNFLLKVSFKTRIKDNFIGRTFSK